MKKTILLLIFHLCSLTLFAQINTDRVLAIGRNALYFEDYVSTKYTVKVFLEDLNGVYQLYENNEIGSVSGILVFPTVESIEGFLTPAT